MEPKRGKAKAHTLADDPTHQQRASLLQLPEPLNPSGIASSYLQTCEDVWDTFVGQGD